MGGRADVWGLGPTDAALIPSGLLDAVAAVGAAATVVRTARHPAFAALPGGLVTCDDLYESGDAIEDVYAAIVERVVDVARLLGAALYVVPGSPLIAERTVELLREREDIEVVVHPALSFLDLAWERLGIDPVDAGVRVVNGHAFDRGAGGATLVAQCDSRHVLAEIKLSLDDGPDVVVLQRLGLPDESVTTVAWHDLDRVVEPDHLTSLFIALPADELTAFADLVKVLRERCPWDAEQTHESLTRFMLEEAYEAVEAIASGDVDATCGELGDVLFQVVLHAAIAEESGDFNLADVARGIREKLVRRHRHVFGDVVAETPEDVEAMWAAIKAEERGRPRGDADDPFADVDGAQPALTHAAQIGRRAEAVDFDWPDVAGPLDKLAEEIAELSEALRDHGKGSRQVTDELGDLLFCAVVVARHAGIPDPESALRAASAKFLRRYAVMRQLAHDRGVEVSDDLWEEAKALA